MATIYWIYSIVLLLVSIVNLNSCNCLYNSDLNPIKMEKFRTRRSIDLVDSEFHSRPKRHVNMRHSNRNSKHHNTAQASLALAPALLLTTTDTIALVYPKEMGYEKDFLHVIYKINNQKSDSSNQTAKASGPQISYRIEDAVYDNQTWSIYFAVTNSSGGTELIRLKRNLPAYLYQSANQVAGVRDGQNGWSRPRVYPNEFIGNRSSAIKLIPEHSYQLASNWTRTVVYRNSSVNILSMDINVKKRRIYWFEFNKVNKKWSIVLANRLTVAAHGHTGHMKLRHFTFDHYTHRSLFANDGYTFIAVARDVLHQIDYPSYYQDRQTAQKAVYYSNKQKLRTQLLRGEKNRYESQESRSDEPNALFRPVSSVLLTPKHDIVVFISNNQTLNICFLINMTCEDYFKAPTPQAPPSSNDGPDSPMSSKPKSYFNYETSYDNENYDLSNSVESDEEVVMYDSGEGFEYGSTESSAQNPASSTSSSTTTRLTSSTTTLPPIYRFGRLMGIKYDPIEHALYLADYGYDRIEKLTFEKQYEYDSAYSFKFRSLESILKSSEYGSQFQQAPLNPMMSVFFDNYIFWIDYEEGLKTTVHKSSCVRSIYKVKEASTLKFIQIGTYRQSSESDSSKENRIADSYSSSSSDSITSPSIHILNRLVSLQDQSTRFQYPPDYYFYYPNGMTEESSSGSEQQDSRPNSLSSRVQMAIHSGSNANQLPSFSVIWLLLFAIMAIAS